MYIFKNAIISIIRTKGRNALIGTVLFVIAIACTITLSIKNASTNLVDSYVSKFDITATISIDRKSFMSGEKTDPGLSREERNAAFASIEPLTIEDIKNYGNSTYLKDYYYTVTASMNATNIEAITSDTNSQIGFRNNGGSNGTFNIGDFNVIGYSSTNAMKEFFNGKYTIVDGSVFENFDDNECIISDELANENEISIGDAIILTNPNDETISYSLIVKGIYTDNSTDESQFSMFSTAANQIITGANIALEMANSSSSKSNINPTFVLVDEDIIDKFNDQLTDKGLSNYYTLNTNLDDVTASIEPIQNVGTFATTFLLLIIIIGSIVLFVINLINVRERKYEIGVLRTIGMKKTLVISQFVVELLVVAVISLTIGTLGGAVLSKSVANNLLKNEISSLQEEATNVSNNFGRPTGMINNSFGKNNAVNKNVEYIDKLEVSVNTKVLLQMLTIGIALTIVSSSVAMTNIARFSPLKILKERS